MVIAFELARRLEARLPITTRRRKVARPKLGRGTARVATLFRLKLRSEAIVTLHHGKAVVRKRLRLPGLERRPEGGAVGAGLRTAMSEARATLRAPRLQVAMMMMAECLRRAIARSDAVAPLIITP